MEEEAMLRLAIVLSVFALLACGGSETSQTGDAGEALPVEETVDVIAIPEPAVTVDPKVQSCLDLVRRVRFQQALVVCLAALEIDPDNQQVQDAVATARAETAKLAAAQAAGAATAEGAAEEATSQLGEATGGMADKLGE
jgi:hypothetical protein